MSLRTQIGGLVKGSLDRLYRTNDGSSSGHHDGLMPSVGSTCEKIMDVTMRTVPLGRIFKLMKSGYLRKRNSALLPRTTILESLLLPYRKNQEGITVRWAT